MPVPDQTGRRRHNVVNLSSVRLFVCLFVCYQTCEHDILEKNEHILMQMCTSAAQGKGMKGSTLWVRR